MDRGGGSRRGPAGGKGRGVREAGGGERRVGSVADLPVDGGGGGTSGGGDGTHEAGDGKGVNEG
jgi:hypothetical protein